MRTQECEVGEAPTAYGGLFHEFQLRLGLLKQNSLQSGRRAALFVALAWGAPLLMSFIAGRAIGPLAARPFLLDPNAWARFTLAIALFILTEGRIEEQLRRMLRQFTRGPLLAPTSVKAAAVAANDASTRRDSYVAELVCFALALACSMLSLVHLLDSGTESWAVRVAPEGVSITAAGWWCLLFSSPLFFFLLLRGLWRHFVWSMLLRRFAAMKLRLVATHPDGKAGLAFVGRYPNIFVPFVFGLSCLIGAALAHQLLHETISLTAYGYVMGVWLILVLALFAYPLLAFSRPLIELKQNTLLLIGAEGTRFERQTERKLFGSNVAAPDSSEVEEKQGAVDPAKQFEATRKMSTLLLNRSAVLPMCASALLPLVAAGATQMPYRELLNVCKKLLVL